MPEIIFYINNFNFFFFRLNPQLLLEQVPNLGLIIDLTDTYRYYCPSVFKEMGIEHKKINIPGHVLPPEAKHKE